VDVDAPDYIKKASRIIELDNLNEEERKVATIYELAEEAWENDVSGAYLLGKDEGVLDGKIEDTVNMVKEVNFSLTKAMSITHLPESARGRLIDELKRLKIIYRT
jgi:hypothetical protein